jgi:hypothetical protein
MSSSRPRTQLTPHFVAHRYKEAIKLRHDRDIPATPVVNRRRHRPQIIPFVFEAL